MSFFFGCLKPGKLNLLQICVSALQSHNIYIYFKESCNDNNCSTLLEVTVSISA